MPYVRLGKSGLMVSKIILGCMSYGSKDWQDWVLEEEEALQHIKTAYDAGIQTFDTANVYSNGVSEIILGKAIKKFNIPRNEIVIMTKVRGAVGRAPGVNFLKTKENPEEVGYVNQSGLNRKVGGLWLPYALSIDGLPPGLQHIFESVEASLERLQVKYIDLLQCHRFDNDTPIEETMQALHDVVQAGLVRYIGMSSCWAWQFHAMQNYAINNKLTPFISMQNQHNLVYREEEREMFPTCKDVTPSFFAFQYFGVGIIPWSPLARGFVARPLGQQTVRGGCDMFINQYDQNHPNNRKIVERVEEVAKKMNVTMAQVAIAWTLQKEGVTAPIVGTTSLENLKDIIGKPAEKNKSHIRPKADLCLVLAQAGVHVKLSPEDVAYLEELYQPQAIIGHA
ncbi:hypothetical protein FRB90_004464 [Tulasnella sp. 427]|nr:hypothetical protein FRB90_004464 [Tulasnella sp. 427]